MTTPYYQDDMVTLHHGPALALAALLEPASIQTIVTSPPYWGLRDYGVDGQLGNEKTVDEYVANLVALFAALRPALADDGTVWLNIGDTYAAKARGTDKGWDKSRLTNPGRAQKRQAGSLRKTGERHRGEASGIDDKNLVMVPFRVALALQADGWIVRDDIVWSKPNPMPESVSDRPTRAHEFIFLMSKSKRYYYDAAAIAEPVTGSTLARLGQNVEAQPGSDRAPGAPMKARGPKFGGVKDSEGDAGTDERFRTKRGGGYENDTGMANKRDVWTIATTPFKGAHFAVFPQALVVPCVLAGSRGGGYRA